MSAILFYITGHGFGHAVRSNQVILALKQAAPQLQVHVRTTAPEWLFDNPQAPVSYSRAAIDVGIVQPDSLEMDLGETLRSCRVVHEQIPALVKRECEFVRENGIRLILADIPPLAFEVAARASIPSVAITNFTWSFIYRAYLGGYPDFLPLIEEIEQFYRRASLALTLPYPCDMAAFARREPIPWIARTSSLSKQEARTNFALPEFAKVVLLSFGGFGLERLPWSRLKRLRDYFFVATGGGLERDGNLLILPEAQRSYQDLVRAADLVVSKPGYGIVADVIAHRVPILYTERGEFPEYPHLVRALAESATAEFISQNDLLSGNIGAHIDRLLNKKRNWPTVALSGAAVAAKKILHLLDTSSS